MRIREPTVTVYCAKGCVNKIFQWKLIPEQHRELHVVREPLQCPVPVGPDRGDLVPQVLVGGDARALVLQDVQDGGLTEEGHHLE